VVLVGLDTMFQRSSAARHFTRLAVVVVLAQLLVAQAARRWEEQAGRLLETELRLVLTRQEVAAGLSTPLAQVAQASSM
jgi:hypothetical protein